MHEDTATWEYIKITMIIILLMLLNLNTMKSTYYRLDFPKILNNKIKSVQLSIFMTMESNINKYKRFTPKNCRCLQQVYENMLSTSK